MGVVFVAVVDTGRFLLEDNIGKSDIVDDG